MATKQYLVLSPILADKHYDEGDVIQLEDSQVAELQFYNAIGTEPIPAAKQKAA